jgi:hypothetical protein
MWKNGISYGRKLAKQYIPNGQAVFANCDERPPVEDRVNNQETHTQTATQRTLFNPQCKYGAQT